MNKTRRHNQQGFSIVELMVVIAVMMIITGAVFALLRDSLKISTTNMEMTDAQETLRVAHEYINRDLLNAGDGLNSINNIRVQQTFATNYLTLNPITDPSTPGILNLGILVSDNNVTANTAVLGTNPAVTVRSNPVLTDRLSILEIDPNFVPISLAASAINANGNLITIAPADVSKFAKKEVYFVTSAVGGTFGTITNILNPASATPQLVFNADTLGLNTTGAGGQINTISAGGTLPTSLCRMKIIHYFIDSNGLLIRRVFGVKSVNFTDSIIAEHVVSLQVRYLLNLSDTNGNLVQPVAQLTSSQEQVGSRQVEVTLTVETPHAIHNGQRQQITMTTSTSVRNMQFRQALQPGAGG